MSPEKMIERVLAGDGEAGLVWDLYGAFYKGFPIENFKRLLESDDPEVTAVAAFLANELGHLVRPYAAGIAELIDHPDPQARSDAIHGLRPCIGREDIEIVGRIILALDDPDDFVHRAAMFFILMTRSIRWLVLGAKEAAKRAPKRGFTDISNILPSCGEIDKAKLTQFISHANPVVRRFGVGLSARAKFVVDADFLEIARDCRDAEGLRMVEYISDYPKPVGARIAKLSYIESGSEKERRARQCNLNLD